MTFSIFRSFGVKIRFKVRGYFFDFKNSRPCACALVLVSVRKFLQEIGILKPLTCKAINKLSNCNRMNKRPSTVVRDLNIGSSIYVSFVNWYEEADYDLTECGTEAKLRHHFVEGILESIINKPGKVQKTFKFYFPSLEEWHSFSLKELHNHPNTFFSPSDLPEGAFVMKRKGDLNPLVLDVEDLPSISESDIENLPESVQKFIKVAGQREQALKDLYIETKKELLKFKCLGVSIVDIPSIVDKVPPSLAVAKDDADQEEERQNWLLHCTYKTPIADSLGCVKAFQFFCTSQLYKILGFKRRSIFSSASWKTTCSLSQMQNLIVPMLQLNGFVSSPEHQLWSGHLFQLVGSSEGLRKSGIEPKATNFKMSPFQRCNYYSEEEAVLGSHYALLKASNGNELPLIINPGLLCESDFWNNTKVQNELGAHFDAGKSRDEMLHLIMQGRLLAQNNPKHNFGIRWWAMIEDSAEHPIVIDVLQMSDSIDICIVEFRCHVHREEFTIHRDANTGLVQKVLGDA